MKQPETEKEIIVNFEIDIDIGWKFRKKLIDQIAGNHEIVANFYEHINEAKESHKKLNNITKGKWEHVKIKDQSDEIEAHRVMIESVINDNRKRAKITAKGSFFIDYFKFEHPFNIWVSLMNGYTIKGLIEGSNIPEAIKELTSTKEALLKFKNIDEIKDEIKFIEALLVLFKLKRHSEWIPFYAIGKIFGMAPNQAYNYAKRIAIKEINEKSFKRFYEAKGKHEKSFKRFYIKFYKQFYTPTKAED